MTIPVFQRETDDWLPAPVTIDGVNVISGVSYCITLRGVRPVTFTASVLRTDRIGVKVTGLSVGTYDVYARVSAPPDLPVIKIGMFYID